MRKNDSKNESWTEAAKALTASGKFKKGRAEKLAKAAVYTRSTLPVRKAKARAVKAAARAASAERIPGRGEILPNGKPANLASYAAARGAARRAGTTRRAPASV